MSWNGGSTTTPNWAGEDQAQAEASVGDLYITPDPPTIASNPSIGLEGRNEVPLPTAYKDFSVDDLNAVSINNNPNFDASNWSLYRAISNVQGTLGLFSVPLYSISDFLNLTVANSITAQAGSVTAGLNVVGGVSVSAPLGGFNQVTAEDINVSFTNETADVNIYGANLLAGDNALYVEGGTTLTGGGIIHGVTIGALQVAGIDTVRIDVLPAGMLLTSATFLTVTAAGATTVTAGGVLALAGGSYISYNSDQHYFINTTSGNDFTDIYVGNIHGADGGSAPLRINDAGRGVELANVKSINLFVETFPTWSDTTVYAIDDKVQLSAVGYKALFANRNTAPNVPIPNWVGGGTNYEQYEIVFSAGFVYQALTQITGSVTAPASDPDWLNMGFTTNAITNIWTTEVPFVSTITGDNFSTITIGAIVAPVDFVRVDGDGFVAGGTTTGLDKFNYIDLVAQTGSDATIYFSDSANALQSKIFIDNTAKRLIIQSDTGLTINSTGATTTDFSAGVVEDLKTLNLTTTLFPLWNVLTTYGDNAEVSYGDENWVSQFAGNRGNIPSATLQDWVSLGSYAVGNVRYYATDNKAYLCIAVVFGVSTPPPSDPTKWSLFQTGSNGEDVWYPFTAPVVSEIVGDKLSEITIGNQSFVNGNGEYLRITNIVEGDPPDANQNALIQSTGALALAGADSGVQVVATAGDVNLVSVVGEVVIQSVEQSIGLGANVDVNIVATTGDITIATDNTTGGNILITSNGTGAIIAKGNAGFTSSEGDATITATLGAVNINSDAGAVNMGSTAETSITSGDYMVIQAQESIDITSNNNTIIITAEAGVDLNATTNDINLTTTSGSTNIVSGGEIDLEATGGNIRIRSTTADVDITSTTGNVSITTPTGGNVAVNTYYPPLTIYKNETIGSAISRAANTAEIQVYSQTYTLKATTQYLLNMTYSGLTENASTATPNNNWYIIYRVHPGTTLTTANLVGVAQIFNNTQIGAGAGVPFMTTTSGTYTGRFYIRNQNATVALTVANISATVTEVF